MNCRQGDLAVVVRTGPLTGNCLGKLISVISPVGDVGGYASWSYEPTLHRKDGSTVEAVEDCCLRPIRESAGEDEMLRIAGKPSKISYKEKADL